MKISKKQETEIWQVYDTWLNSYLSGDVDTYDSFLDDGYHFIGSALREEFLNRKDATQFFADTGDQFAGKTDIRNDTKTLEQFGELILITHVLDGWFLHDNEWNFYSRFRFTSALRKNKEGWRFIYQHFSIPDPKTAEGETIGYDKINEENQILREAIQRRTTELEQKNRELEVETALERIRAQAVAMKTSSDLLDIVVTMRNEFIKLGHEAHYFWHMMWLPEIYEKAMSSGDGSKIGFVMQLPRHIHGNIPKLANWENSNEPTVVYTMNVEEAIAYVDQMVNLGNFKNIDPQAPSHNDIKQIGGLTFIMARTTHGEIGYSLPGVVKNPPNEDLKILIKFAGAFDLAHQRFLDLQKSENQARETQIELALEKIRSRSMAMQKSDELKEVIQVVYDQFVQLNVNIDHSGFILDYKEHEDMHIWLADHNAVFPKVVLPYFDCPHWNSFIEAKKTGENFFTNQLTFEEKNKFYKDLFQFIPDLPEETKNIYFDFEGLAISTVLLDSVGLYIENYSGTAFSDSENAILMRFGKVFQQSYTRFLDLQKAEAQARETQIQLALERVRAKTMAMTTQSDLLGIIELFGEQLLAVNVRFDNVTFIEGPITKKRDWDLWSYAPEAANTTDKILIPYIETPYFTKTAKVVEAYEATGNPIQVKTFTKDEKNEFLDHYWKYAPVLSDEFVANVYNTPGSIIVDAFLDTVTVSLVRWDLELFTDKELAIFERFSKEFKQTYIRFLDIKKAEDQAREAQIEVSLERLRSKAMSMQQSEELHEVLAVLFEQFDILGIKPMSTHMTILDIKNNKFTFRETGKFGNRGFGEHTFALDAMDTWKDMVESWQKSQPFGINRLHFPKENLAQVWQVFKESFASMPEESRIYPDDYPDGIYHTAGKHPFGYIGMNQIRPATEEEEQIVIKFANEFGRVYQRFLDLQKAEIQAREAQIEAALEKVRSRSLAMQSPDELMLVAQLLREEMGALGVEELETSSIYIYEQDSGLTQCWFTIKDQENPNKSVTDQMTINLADTWVGRQMLDFYNSDAQQTSILMQGERRMEWISYCGEKSNIFKPEGFYGDAIPNRSYHLYKFSNGYIGAASPGKISAESWDLLKRATAVFSFAYTRFLDLQKAEIRAREARIELALERIRAKVASMQESSDLFDIVVVMRKEFLALGHDADYFWHMKWLPESYEMSMTSEDGNRIGMVISLPKFVHDQIPALAEWEKGTDPLYVLALDAEGAWNYIENMNIHGHYELADPNAPGKEDIEQIGGLTFIMARTTHGEIGYSLPGMVPQPPKEALETLLRFAGVFDLAYKRFEDLKAAEYQAQMIREERDRLEIALNELRATQAQLIQQEKLASLGQLTAGIAHEIKNPLNFVNNFSEVSIELIDEALHEIGQIENNTHASESGDILADVKANLTKIHEHGSRADSIVKSMLMHSRGGSGKMEPSHLNTLIKEYVNLAYHGMRAGKHPISVIIDLKFDAQIDHIPLVEEDFSRVLLNLCNNAFDAMREKQNANVQIPNSNEYRPKLTVRSISKNGKVTIEIQDNGPGIPNDIRDKILQPFFTTKKGTEGTGLGLSITHDIVKAHGGQLEIETSEENGTTFSIHLDKKE